MNLTIQELSESVALTMASKFFGSAKSESRESFSGLKSDYAIDPVTPFDNIPDPDAPSKAEMIQNFYRRNAVRTLRRVSLLSLLIDFIFQLHAETGDQPAKYAQLALHSFFVPAPSPMFEGPAVVNHVNKNSIRVKVEKVQDTMKALDHSLASQKSAKSSGSWKVERGTSVKPRTNKPAVARNGGTDFDKPQNGVFDFFFKDSSVGVTPNSAKALATASIRAKYLSMLNKTPSAVNNGHMVDAEVGRSSLPAASSRTRQTSIASAAHVRAQAAKMLVAQPAKKPFQASTVVQLPKKTGHAVHYGGIFGNPFADNAVSVSEAQAAPSWL